MQRGPCFVTLGDKRDNGGRSPRTRWRKTR